MSLQLNYPHLKRTQDGKLCIEGTRYSVSHLAGEHFHYGWTAEEIMRQHPDLKPVEVYAVLTYFYDHYDEVVQEICDDASKIPLMTKCASLSREELLRRSILKKFGTVD